MLLLPLTDWTASSETQRSQYQAVQINGGTSKRRRRDLNPALEYAVQRGILKANPLTGLKVATAKTSRAIDKRCVMNPQQASALLAWVYARPRGGHRLHAFFATQYYAGLRPEESVALRVRDAVLPEQGWGEFLVHAASPEVGKNWTDSGDVHDERHLKGRARGESRSVPIHPALVAILRAHIETEVLKPGDLIYQGENGGILAGSVYRRAWNRAREKVLSVDDCASPLAKRVYDLRHTCLTTWLNSGVPAPQVAEWAGNSVAVLLETYARCIAGQDADLKRRIEQALSTAGATESQA